MSRQKGSFGYGRNLLDFQKKMPSALPKKSKYESGVQGEREKERRRKGLKPVEAEKEEEA